ncbi:hypothetical protein FB561_7242 [Kribbella amoyensis]|uniref:Uncharacterized protein n=1 Tax=Kribbella amoyensis TaxID=996641 RepID=A0A561B3B5_9ACTN|nr:hypothetical protein [Kribbella amoyensis]TWD73353.1 hypothetical protein FB561_7242 [Kribbella amoyensis]
MTDDLKQRLHDLVTDQPVPTGDPAEAVFTRVRTIRRRRATGAVTLAVTAVAVVAVAAGNMTGTDSAPPITKSPSHPNTVITAAPPTSPTATTPPTTAPTTRKTAKPPVIPSTRTTEPSTENSTTAPPSPETSGTPAPKPVRVRVSVEPSIDGLEVSMTLRESGSLLVPVIESTGKTKPVDPVWRNNVWMTGYDWGDGSIPGGANGGLLTCDGASRRISGSGSGPTREPHTYKKAGTYTFTYKVVYCGPDGAQEAVATTKLTVKPKTSPSP